MNIEGLDYNTQREPLLMPEYGRDIQQMIDYVVTLPTKALRQRGAEIIVEVMDRIAPMNLDKKVRRENLWERLAIMSDFKLDIDYPVDVSTATKIIAKPQPLTYPMRSIPVKHYGALLFKLFDHLKAMPEGAERDRLAELAANHMKRNLVIWSHGASDDEKVVDDLRQFTGGNATIDLKTFRFAKVKPEETAKPAQGRRRRRR